MSKRENFILKCKEILGESKYLILEKCYFPSEKTNKLARKLFLSFGQTLDIIFPGNVSFSTVTNHLWDKIKEKSTAKKELENLYDELNSCQILHEDLPKQNNFIIKHLGEDLKDYKVLVSESDFFSFFSWLENLIFSTVLIEREENVGYDGSDISYFKYNEIKAIYGGWGCYFIVMKEEHFFDAYEIYLNTKFI